MLDTDPEIAKAKIIQNLILQTNTNYSKINKDNKQKVLAELKELIKSKKEALLQLSGIEKTTALESILELENLKSQYLVSLNDSFASIYVIDAH